MSLQSLVNTINSDYCPEKSVPTVLSLVERAIKRLFNQPCNSSIYFNRSDPLFPWPILKTVSGTLSYDVQANLVDSSGNPITCVQSGVPIILRDIGNVFVKGEIIRSGAYHPNFRGVPLSLTGINPYWGYQFYENYYTVVGNVTSKTEQEGLFFDFLEDPGAHTDQYYVEAFMEHPDINTVFDPVLINLQLWEQAIIDGCIGYMEDFDNGDADGNKKIKKFEEYWVPKFSAYGNKDVHHRNALQTPIREMG